MYKGGAFRQYSEELKLEIAAEIGVYDKVLSGGWRVLSAKESGRIGGLLSRRKRNMQNEDKAKEHASVDG